jgi:tRNA-splicing endonuclease subunit Sen2
MENEKIENQTILSIEQFWSNLCELDSNFPFKYAVYHHYRSKGWILKSGLKYGCDFRKNEFKKKTT